MSGHGAFGGEEAAESHQLSDDVLLRMMLLNRAGYRGLRFLPVESELTDSLYAFIRPIFSGDACLTCTAELVDNADVLLSVLCDHAGAAFAGRLGIDQIAANA